MTHIFFGVRNYNFNSDPTAARKENGRYMRIRRAKEICSECPVLKECAPWSVENQEYGVAGGMTERERKVLKKEQRRNQGMNYGIG